MCVLGIWPDMYKSHQAAQPNAPKSDRVSMTVNRKEFLWLRVKASIQFKILTLTWKAYHDIGPKYLSELLQKRHGFVQYSFN